MPLSDLNFNKYPQYHLDDWLDMRVFNLPTKGIFQTQNQCIKDSILESGSDNKMYVLLLFFHKLITEDYLKNYTFFFKLEKEKEIETLWNTFFHYKVTKNVQPFIDAIKVMIKKSDEEKSNFIIAWNDMSNKGIIKNLYNEDFTREFFKGCVYKNYNPQIIGTTSYPDDFDKNVKKIKNFVSPILDLGSSIIGKTINNFKFKSEGSDLNLSINDYPYLSIDEKINFSKKFIQKNCVYKEAQNIIQNIENLSLLEKKYPNADIITKNDYENLINHHLYELLGFINLSKNQKSPHLFNYVNNLKEYVDDLLKVYNDELNRHMGAKAKFFKEKTNINKKF